MESISHSIATTYAIQSFTDASIKRHDNKWGTLDEQAASKTAKRKTLKILQDVIKSVDDTLAVLRSSARIPDFNEDYSISSNSDFDDVDGNRSNGGHRNLDEDPNAAAKKLLHDMSPDTLSKQNKTILDMATSIAPIVDDFTAILEKPYLENFNASLSTVPVVGLKNNQIMYINTTAKADASKAIVGVANSWALFSTLPADAKITEPNEVHFFPYNGHFYLVVGTSIWMKEHRDANDPEMASAVDNWPKMYYDGWTKIGDTCLPAANLRSVLSFAVLGPKKDLSEPVAFRVVTLDQNNILQAMTSDHLTANNAFSPMNYRQGSTEGSPTEAPKWLRLAYWNNQITGLDDSGNTWDITPDFEGKTFTVDTQRAVEHQFTEFTATEAGPVGADVDGVLWRRLVEPPPKDSTQKDDKPTVLWQKWEIPQDGVTNLGVASPGVLLDLRLLTQTLRSRYLSAQTSVAPAIQKILGFARSHQVRLGQLKEQADIYNSTTSTEEQKVQALAAGKQFCQYAQIWAKILNQSIGGSTAAVEIMAHQLDDVKTQLTIQTQLLKDRLEVLKAQLDADEEQLDRLEAGFWGTLACMLLGLAVAAVGAATESVKTMIAGGLIFAAGLLATLALAITVAVLSKRIAEDNNEIRATNQAIEELTCITNQWTALDTLFRNLNTFWGDLATDAAILSLDDETTMGFIGAGTLSETSAIISAQNITTEIQDACQAYLEVLYRQGVPIPLIFLEDYSLDLGKVNGCQTSSQLANGHQSGSNGDHNEVEGMPLKKIKDCIDGTLPFTTVLFDDSINMDVLFYQVTQYASSRLSQGDFGGFVSSMQYASMVSQASDTRKIWILTATGMWFDTPMLGQTLPMWGGFSPDTVKSWPAVGSTSPDTPEALNIILAAVKLNVIDMLQKTIKFGFEAAYWANKYPSAADTIDKSFKDFQQMALEACKAAYNSAAMANNSFVDFNHHATTFTQNMQVQVNVGLDLIENRKAEAASAISHIKIPWYAFLGAVPAVAVAIYEEKKKKDIENRLKEDVDDLTKQIQLLKMFEDSGHTINGSGLVWQKMAEEVSFRLGDMCSTLDMMEEQIEVSPELYAHFIGQEWGELIKRAQEVLNILGE